MAVAHDIYSVAHDFYSVALYSVVLDFAIVKTDKDVVAPGFPWCSGYHVRFTRGRSPVHTWAETGHILLLAPLDRKGVYIIPCLSNKKLYLIIVNKFRV